MNTHLNYVGMIGAMTKAGIVYDQSDIHYSFLPLAHVFDRLNHINIACKGGRIGYFQGDITKVFEDLAVLRPTYFASVPRLLNRLYDQMISSIKNQSGISRKLIDYAVALKIKRLETSGSFTHALYDKFVFKRFRDILGGRVKMILTGSAPISEETMKFLKISLSWKNIWSIWTNWNYWTIFYYKSIWLYFRTCRRTKCS